MRSLLMMRTYSLLVAALFAAAVPGGAQEPGLGVPLTLDEALQRAAGTSEQVEIAEAGVTRARGNLLQARSGYLPQLNGSLNYSRTLASQFENAFSAPDTTGIPQSCFDPFEPNPALPVGERVSDLEQRLDCPPGGFGGLDFQSVGFGSENTYTLGLALSQPIYTGGRVPAQNRIARAGRASAGIELESARAQLRLAVTEAYFDAQLAGRLVEIAEASLAQTEATLGQVELQEQVGNASEFELLRARVARDNQRPVLIQARTTRELAYLRLKQLLDVPAEQDLDLTTQLPEALPPGLAALDSVPVRRAPVRLAETLVDVQQGQLGIVRSQRLPSLSLTSQYGRLAYPSGSVLSLPGFDDFRTNWTVGAALQVPLFTGGRLRGQEIVAQADVREARARLEQVQKLASIDTRSALAQLEAARAILAASTGTVGQAERAYEIAELRFREGLSTQVELSDARLLLQQAQANRARSARDYEVSRTRVALLPDLPLSSGGTAAASAAGASQGGRTQDFGTAAPAAGGASQPAGAGATATQGQIPGAGTP